MKYECREEEIYLNEFGNNPYFMGEENGTIKVGCFHEGFIKGAKWSDKHPSTELITKILELGKKFANDAETIKQEIEK